MQEDRTELNAQLEEIEEKIIVLHREIDKLQQSKGEIIDAFYKKRHAELFNQNKIGDNK